MADFELSGFFLALKFQKLNEKSRNSSHFSAKNSIFRQNSSKIFQKLNISKCFSTWKIKNFPKNWKIRRFAPIFSKIFAKTQKYENSYIRPHQLKCQKTLVSHALLLIYDVTTRSFGQIKVMQCRNVSKSQPCDSHLIFYKYLENLNFSYFLSFLETIEFLEYFARVPPKMTLNFVKIARVSRNYGML